MQPTMQPRRSRRSDRHLSRCPWRHRARPLPRRRRHLIVISWPTLASVWRPPHHTPALDAHANPPSGRTEHPRHAWSSRTSATSPPPPRTHPPLPPPSPNPTRQPRYGPHEGSQAVDRASQAVDWGLTNCGRGLTSCGRGLMRCRRCCRRAVAHRPPHRRPRRRWRGTQCTSPLAGRVGSTAACRREASPPRPSSPGTSRS